LYAESHEVHLRFFCSQFNATQALSDNGEVVVYECFAYPAAMHQSLPIRLRKMDTPLVTRTLKPNVRDFPQTR